MSDDHGDRLADRFRAFVDEAKIAGGMLYSELSKVISDDPAILTIAAEIRRPPVPNTLFAAVHYLLLREPDPSLSPYYGSLTAHPQDPAEAYPAFRSFVLRHRDELIPMLQTRITQTNEVRRCSYLVPAFQRVFQEGGGRPLSLIDVGSSAGLHLLWDRYHYDYGSGQTGDCTSPVRIQCELRGSIPIPLPETFPPCAFRVGVDLHPIDVRIPEERCWLESLVFPEHEDRRALLKTAIEATLQNPPAMIEGDVILKLPEILNSIPDATTLCVFHCHAMCQLSRVELGAFRVMLVELSRNREIFWLDAEGYEVHLLHLRNGKISRVKLANKDGHGRWLEWLDSKEGVNS
ncbi:MAG TPA: DUF2332 domain-containing protein [Terriglobia bacterium]|nr:DUF2332 domain-containing protein [Terriglobia bacterium]